MPLCTMSETLPGVSPGLEMRWVHVGKDMLLTASTSPMQLGPQIRMPVSFPILTAFLGPATPLVAYLCKATGFMMMPFYMTDADP